MKAFVTGITGFAGTHLSEHLLAGGDHVLGCSRDGRWKAHAPAVLQPLPLLAWDVACGDTDKVRGVLAEFAPDWIFHLAAVSVPRECGAHEPTQFAWEANVLGTQAVVRLALSLPRPPRVLLVSSCHVYAPVPRGREIVAEEAPAGPVGGYGKTKRAAELEVLRAVTDQGLDAVIARAFQHAGPRQDSRLMLSEWCRQMIAPGADAVRVRSLDSCFDMSDVRDVVRAYRLLAARGNRGEIYNVGSGVGWRSGDLYQRLRALTGCDLPVVEVEPGATQQPVADTTRLQNATSWQPQIPMDQTLADTWAYWRAALKTH